MGVFGSNFRQVKSKRNVWDDIGKEESLYRFANCSGKSIEELFETGAEDVDDLRKFFDSVNFDPRGKRCLDIGCGVGRTTRHFSLMFGEAYGCDFSSEMVRKAKELTPDRPNLFFSVNSGVDLRIYEDSFFDFCYSAEVFRHIHTLRIIEAYIKEISRVLKGGGYFKFSADGRNGFQGWRVRRLKGWRMPILLPPIPRCLNNVLVEIGVVGVYSSLIGVDETVAKAYAGTQVSANKLRSICQKYGLSIITVEGEDTKEMWCWGRKA